MSLAVAYMMRKKKKECHGGEMAEGGDPMDAFAKSVKSAFHSGEAKAETEPTPAPAEKKEEKDMNPFTSGMKKAFGTPGYASGGEVHKRKPYENPNPEKDKKDPIVEGHDRHGPIYQSHDSKMAAKKRYQEEHLRKKRDGYAEGGEVAEEMESGYEDMPMPCENCGHTASHAIENQGEDDDVDMIDMIMKKRKGFSKGGQVANDTDFSADKEDAEYDDLVKEDDLAFHETGENSGDEEGDEQEDEDRRDVVSQIMKSRKKKDKMPRPA